MVIPPKAQLDEQRSWTVHVRNLWLDLRETSFLFSEIPERSKPTLNLFTSLILNMQEKTKCPNDRLDLNSNLVFLNIEVLPWSFHRYRAKTIFRKRLSDHFQTQKWIKPDTIEFLKLKHKADDLVCVVYN